MTNRWYSVKCTIIRSDMSCNDIDVEIRTRVFKLHCIYAPSNLLFVKSIVKYLHVFSDMLQWARLNEFATLNRLNVKNVRARYISFQTNFPLTVCVIVWHSLNKLPSNKMKKKKPGNCTSRIYKNENLFGNF